LVRKVIKLQV